MPPAFSGSPFRANVCASQAAALSGLPSAAAPTPVEAVLPPTSISIAAPSRSSPVSGRPFSASTKKADEPLSATVSAKDIFKSEMRLSNISIAPWTLHTAAPQNGRTTGEERECRRALFLSCLREPGGSVERVAKRCCAHAGRGGLATHVHLHRCAFKIEPGERQAIFRQHEEGRRAIVRYRIGKGYFPVGDAAVDNLDRGMDTRHGRRDLFDRRIRVGQIGAKDERNFGFGFWLKSLCRIERAAIAHAHILEQHSEVGLVDAELRLHCLRGQPGLASDDSPPLAFPEARVDRLYGVGAVGIGRLQRLAERRHSAACLSVAQP